MPQNTQGTSSRAAASQEPAEPIGSKDNKCTAEPSSNLEEKVCFPTDSVDVTRSEKTKGTEQPVGVHAGKVLWVSVLPAREVKDKSKERTGKILDRHPTPPPPLSSGDMKGKERTGSDQQVNQPRKSAGLIDG